MRIVGVDSNVPTCNLEDDEVEEAEWEYSDRAPGDWVISGPLPSGSGPGRWFPNWAAAERWARSFYGDRLRGPVREAKRDDANRWAFVIKNRGSTT